MTRGAIHLVGVGPGGAGTLTQEAYAAIRSARELWCLDLGPPGHERAFLRPLLAGKKVVNLSPAYALPDLDRGRLYRQIAERLIHLATRGRSITFLFSGNPLIWVDIPEMLKRASRAGRLDLRISPAVSFVDAIWEDAPIHGGEFQLRAGRVTEPNISPALDTVVGQISEEGELPLCHELRRLFGLAHPVFVTGIYPQHGERQSILTEVAGLPLVLPQFRGLFYAVIIPKKGARSVRSG